MRLINLLMPIRKLIVSALVLAVLLVLAYWAFCDRVCTLAEVPMDDKAVLVGIVEDVCVVEGEGATAAFRLVDPTGKVFVVSHRGPPREGCLVIVWGTRQQTDEGRTIVIETRRLGSF